MQTENATKENTPFFASRTALVLSALSIGGLFALTTGLWLQYGERMFFDRLIAAIAGCF